eukprot:6224005-Prymnesium_polylepis.1
MDLSEEIVGLPKAQGTAGIVFTNGPVRHGVPRKASEEGLLRPAFVQASEAIILSHTAHLLDHVGRAADRGTALDMQRTFAAAALDIVGELAFAQSIGALDGRQNDLEAHIMGFLESFSALLTAPLPYWRYVPRHLMPAHARYARMIMHGQRLLELATPLVARRRALLDRGAAAQEPACFVDMLLVASKEHGVSDAEVLFNA